MNTQPASQSHLLRRATSDTVQHKLKQKETEPSRELEEEFALPPLVAV